MINVYYLNHSIKKCTLSELDSLCRKKVWVDVIDITPDEKKLLCEKFELHPLTAEDLFKQNVRIKVEEFKKYLFCVFYGLKNVKTGQLTELDFVIGKNFLITNHKGKIESFETLKENKLKISKLLDKGVDFLFHRLMDYEVQNYFYFIDEVDEHIARIDSEITEKKPHHELLQKILKLKQRILSVKRHTVAQREKISFLAKNEYTQISELSLPYFRDLYDHVIRVADEIDDSREAITNARDAYMSSLSNRMNEVIKVLSVIATTALPITAIAGIYGTNFKFLPGLNSPYGFWIMILAMICVSSSMALLFKRRGWY